jgi:hypothetical protein
MNLNDRPPFLVHSALQMTVNREPEPSTWATMLIVFGRLIAAGIRKAPRHVEA